MPRRIPPPQTHGRCWDSLNDAQRDLVKHLIRQGYSDDNLTPEDIEFLRISFRWLNEDQLVLAD